MMSRNETDTRSAQAGCVVWFTGLSGAGKTTLATALETALSGRGLRIFQLDGDIMRQGLCRDLGFAASDRDENIRRVAEVAKLFADCGVLCICAFISPFRSMREKAREIIGTHRFIEVHVSTTLETCEKRDAKGLYEKARAGDLPDFTGVSSPYEAPERPDVEIDTTTVTLRHGLANLLGVLEERGLIPASSSETDTRSTSCEIHC